VSGKPAWGHVFNSILCGIVLSSCALAQLIDTKDVTGVPVPTEPAVQNADVGSFKELPDKDCFTDHYDGFVMRKHPEKLRLEIVSADTHFVDDNTEIIATVRLKNEGRWPVLLPWQTDPVEPKSTGNTNDKVSYEAAGLRLKLGTQGYRTRGAFLEGSVEFQAVPHSYEQHVRLLHGQWVEIKFRALGRCWLNAADPPLCSEFKADEHAHLTAHWGEWLITEQGVGCKATSSSLRARKIDSDPVEIEFVPAGPRQPSSPHEN
jgi:hypothetical protein